MPKSFKELRKGKLPENFRTWEYGGFSFKTNLPSPRIENESELLSRKLFFQLLQRDEKTEDQLLSSAEQKNLFERLEKKYGKSLDEVEKECRNRVIVLQEDLDRISPNTIPLEDLRNTPRWEKIVEMSQEISDLRQKLMDISTSRNEIVGGGIEAQADIAKQAFIITKCTFVDAREEGEEQPKWIPVWETIEEFENEEDRVLVNLARLEYGLFSMGLKNDTDTLDSRFPENRILREVRRMEGDTDKLLEPFNNVPTQSIELKQSEPNSQIDIPFDSKE